jgi:putative ABC transport system ATP-binding protein
MALLTITNVSKTYHRGDDVVKALVDISIGIESGAFTALSGPSGSGKSSLLNIIGTLDAPDCGEVALGGTPVDFRQVSAVERLRREKFGFVFQNFNLIPVLTAQENVEMTLLMRPISVRERRERAAETLNAVGLGDRMDHYPRQLSGGQQQRVAVARALVSEPVMVLADEPTANLDTTTAYQLLDVMKEMNEQRQTAFVFSTHDQRILERATRIVRLQDGRIVG